MKSCCGGVDCYAQPEFCITHLGGVIYQNRRPDYFNTFLDKLISWEAEAELLAQAKAFVNLGQQTVPGNSSCETHPLEQTYGINFGMFSRQTQGSGSVYTGFVLPTTENGIEGPDIFSLNNECCQLVFLEWRKCT
jgi:hypothetical protein